MSDTIHVGTRKGLFTLRRKSSGWEIDKLDFLGEPATMLLHDPRDGTLYCSLTLGHFGVKLHRSSDGGSTWEECGVPVYPEGAEIPVRSFDPAASPPPKPASLSEIWALESAGADRPRCLWAGTIPGGLFYSSDRGSTWQLNDALWNWPGRMKWFGGGKDDAGIHSIFVNPKDSQHVTIAISCGGVLETRNGGATWETRSEGLRADFVPPPMQGDPDIQDAHRLAVCPAQPDWMWVQHHNGIFQTNNGGRQWRELTEVQPSVFGFAVCVHPRDGKTAWFVPAIKDQYRVPVDGKLVVTRTRDGGQSFETLRTGLPQQHCYDLVFRHGLDIDKSGQRLVMGSSTGGLWITEDGGDHWQVISTTLPQIYTVRFAAA